MISDIHHIERELKLDLCNRRNFMRLLKALGKPSGLLIQENHFFDTVDGFLRSRHYALRLRLENGKYFVTVKGRANGNRELSERAEVECRIRKNTGEKIILSHEHHLLFNTQPVIWLAQEIAPEISTLSLSVILSFVNRRSVFRLKHGRQVITLELDETCYGKDMFSYELEAEFNEDGMSSETRFLIEDILKKTGIPWKISKKSKFARALFFNNIQFSR